MRPTQPADLEGVEPGVDLADGEHVRRRVAGLHDATDAAPTIPHDAAEGGRIVHVHGHEGHDRVRVAPRRGQLLEQAGVDEGHVARQDQDLCGVLGKRLERGAQGVSGPTRLCLQCEAGLPGEHLAHRIGGRRDDHQRGPPGRRHGGVDDVGEHGATADGVQHLRQSRPHAGAQPGRKHDRGERSESVRVHVEAGTPGREGG